MTDNDFVVSNGVLKDYTGNDSDITVPNGVTSIGLTFTMSKTLTSISLPDSLKTIDFLAFDGCENLKKITLPDKLHTIRNDAFEGCVNLKSIVLPESVNLIEYRAFYGCKNLEICIEGTPVCEEGSLFGVKKIIAPELSLSSFTSIKEKRSAVRGFLSNRSRYKNKSVVDEYKIYILKQKKMIISEIFADDDVRALSSYLEIKKNNIKSFRYEYLQPAKAADAVKCIDFLLEWEDRNILTIYQLQDITEFL
ncbi:MAG: leucine-rich repeat domain-containing protein [Oscillospiraceae bacterium]|nr:leucine-rich repeat domain-containing protein [Oscillospiraceae bacterium]